MAGPAMLFLAPLNRLHFIALLSATDTVGKSQDMMVSFPYGILHR